MNSVYVDLDRRFLEFSDEENSEDSALRSYLNEYIGKGLDWDRLLCSRYVVILGEAGSGKTWELRAQAEKLKSQRKFSFYVPLERLANSALVDALEPNDLESYKRWRRSKGEVVSTSERPIPTVVQATAEATFFLDAVDEAKLLRTRAFDDALVSLIRGVEQTRGGIRGNARIRIVLSCRVSEWRGNADRDLLRERFGISASHAPARKIADSSPDLQIVQLAPLDLARVGRLAASTGLDPVAPFLNAVRDADAESFIRRPKDVLNLVAYWKVWGRFGRLAELIEFDVAEKLRESEERNRTDPLSTGDAHAGAQALAAAAVFCRRPSFLIPDETISPTLAAQAIDPMRALAPDWTAERMRALLGRPIFDEATYGRVRLHHRTTAEFLAAKWLKSRWDNGCPVREIEELIFRFVHGREVVPPSLAPIAAWLTIGSDPFVERISRRIMRVAPEVLLGHGDPQSLRLEVRRELLRAVIEKFADRQRFRISTDGEQLKRIAHEDLAPDLNNWISDKSLSEDSRELSIRIAWHGRLQGCVPMALKVIQDKTEPEGLRHYSILLTGDCGLLEPLHALAEIVRKSGRFSSRTCELLCNALFPRAVDVGTLINFIRRTNRRKGRRRGEMKDVVIAAIGRASDSQLPELLEALLNLAERPPHAIVDNKLSVISNRYSWLGSPLMELTKRILQTTSLDTNLVEPIVHALHLISESRRFDRQTNEKDRELQIATERHPMVRRAYVWAEFDRLNNLKRGQTYVHQLFGYFDDLALSATDRDWILDDLTCHDDDQRVFALKLASAAWRIPPVDTRYRRKVRALIRKDKLLKANFRMEFPGRFRRLYWRLRRTLNDLIRWKARNYWYSQGVRWLKIKNWWYFRTRLQRLRRGNLFGALHHLVWVRFDSPSSDGAERSVVETVRDAYGVRVASAAREGWKRFWRTFTPPLPHEVKNAPNGVHVGLQGIAADLEDGLTLSQISNSEAEIMARYAAHELNEFPGWFEALCKAKPEAVRNVLQLCIDAEWGMAKELPHVIEILSKLRHATQDVCRLIDRYVWEKMLASEPQHRAVLAQALEVVLIAQKVGAADVAHLAGRRTRSRRFGEPHFLIWLTLWLSVDGAAAADFLQDYVVHDPTNAVALFEQLGSALGERNRHDSPIAVPPSYLDATNLARLIPLFFRYVRRAEDIEHHELVVYSPTARDTAQDFRDRLLQTLAEQGGDGVYEALSSLTSHSDIVESRDFVLHLIDRLLARQAESVPWQPEDVAAFAQEHEVTPRSGYSLYRIVLKRLLDIKFSVETDDYSRRAELRPDAHEAELQKWLARLLRETRRGRYAEVREAEVDDEKTPDIRVLAPNLPPTSIEVKWAHKFSYSELVEALETQLVGQYLRAPDSHYGILLLANGRYKTWKGDKGSLDFAALVAELRDKANEISRTNANIEGLEIVTINALPP